MPYKIAFEISGESMELLRDLFLEHPTPWKPNASKTGSVDRYNRHVSAHEDRLDAVIELFGALREAIRSAGAASDPCNPPDRPYSPDLAVLLENSLLRKQLLRNYPTPWQLTYQKDGSTLLSGGRPVLRLLGVGNEDVPTRSLPAGIVDLVNRIFLP